MTLRTHTSHTLKVAGECLKGHFRYNSNSSPYIFNLSSSLIHIALIYFIYFLADWMKYRCGNYFKSSRLKQEGPDIY